MDNIKRETRKYTDLTPYDIKAYLSKFRRFILDGKYSIAQNENRQENVDFIEDYKTDTRKEKAILLGIQYDDFCYAVDNNNEEFCHEVLYIFCKCQELDYWGTLESVDIYIKINMTQMRNGDDFVFIVSFHKRNKPIEYLFK